MNRNTLIDIALLATGAAIGSVVTWKLLETKYERIAQEEIESVKEAFEEFKERLLPHDEPEPVSVPVEPERRSTEKPPLAEYAARVQALGYGEEEPEEKEETQVDRPYVIAPEDFDELGYEAITLYYYEDGVVADECDNIVDNVDELIGEESLSHFGEYEEDSVFVRNDAKQCDYEILKCQGNFGE